MRIRQAGRDERFRGPRFAIRVAAAGHFAALRNEGAGGAGLCVARRVYTLVYWAGLGRGLVISLRPRSLIRPFGCAVWAFGVRHAPSLRRGPSGRHATTGARYPVGVRTEEYTPSHSVARPATVWLQAAAANPPMRCDALRGARRPGCRRTPSTLRPTPEGPRLAPRGASSRGASSGVGARAGTRAPAAGRLDGISGFVWRPRGAALERCCWTALGWAGVDWRGSCCQAGHSPSRCMPPGRDAA